LIQNSKFEINLKIMLAYLSGKIQNKGKGYIILRTGDVGYKLFVNGTIYAALEIGQLAEFYTHQYVREDALDLYGFKTMEELELFELLISISGIGPKSALGVLAIASPDDLREAITRGDSTLLTKVSGIGKKTAERVVLELRDKVTTSNRETGSGQNTGIMASGDEIDALMALGYSMVQARDALKKVNPQLTDSGERIREALQKM
jgi:holliday junction DNA helicase RuvA